MGNLKWCAARDQAYPYLPVHRIIRSKSYRLAVR